MIKNKQIMNSYNLNKFKYIIQLQAKTNIIQYHQIKFIEKKQELQLYIKL